MPATVKDKQAFWQRLTKTAERSQDEAVRKLKGAGLSEAEVLIALEHFRAVLNRLLTDADSVYSTYETLRLSQPGRTAANQEWLDSQFARLVLVYEEALTAAVRGAAQNVTRSAASPPPPIGEGFGEWRRLPPRRSRWVVDLRQVAKLLLWLVGLGAGFLLFIWVTNGAFWGALLLLSLPLAILLKWRLSRPFLLVPLLLLALFIVVLAGAF